MQVKNALYLLILYTFEALHAESNTIKDIVSDINNYTKIATETKQNIDYMPFIMSVWEGNKLEKLGVRTLKDALMLFPGVDVSTDNLRNQTLIFRGSNPFAYGQSKLLIDGISVNDRMFDSYTVYLEMPIEIIKRIEVVRGAGAFADGMNGYAGTINVVTYAEDASKDGDKISVSAGSYSSHSANALYNAKIGEWVFHTDVYYYKDSSKIATNGKDVLAYSPVNSSLSKSGYAPTGLNTYAAGMSISNKEFSLSARGTYYEVGSAFGNLYALPNDDGKQKMPSWYIEGKYTKEIFNEATVETKLGYMEDSWQSYAKSFPSGIVLAKPGGGTTVYPDGYWADLYAKNRIEYIGASLTYEGFESHSAKLGVYLSDEKALKSHSITTNKYTGVGWYDYTDTMPVFDADAAKRKTSKVYVNDMWEIRDNLVLSYGVESDKGSDFDRQNDYRAALVWQVTDSDILKFMTATAYRAPAWQEMYVLNNPARVGNRDLKPERVRTYETQYIKKMHDKGTLSLNLFLLQNKNLINKSNSSNQYRNAADSTIYGTEFEYKKEFMNGSFYYLGYSYIDGNSSPGDDLSSSANHMFKTALVHELGGGFSLGTTLIYVGEKNRAYTDSRDDTPAYTTLDLALSYESKKWGARLGLRNAANATVLYPSEQNTYANDYPTNKQFLFLKLFSRF